MAYIFKVNNDSWGRIIRSSAQVNYDFENDIIEDEFIVTFHESVDFEDIMAASRIIIGQVDDYTLTVEDEEHNILYSSTNYIRLIKSEINLEENDNKTGCIITWSKN